jgi:hypothetical protein
MLAFIPAGRAMDGFDEIAAKAALFPSLNATRACL